MPAPALQMDEVTNTLNLVLTCQVNSTAHAVARITGD